MQLEEHLLCSLDKTIDGVDKNDKKQVGMGLACTMWHNERCYQCLLGSDSNNKKRPGVINERIC